MNKPNPDADLLRRAATLARETANAATEGPWKTHDTHLGSGGHSATVLTDRDKLTDTGLVAWLPTFSHEPWNDNTNAWANATHAALWHPGVALAIADWLDQHAEHHDYDECTRETCHAETTARALLGEDT